MIIKIGRPDPAQARAAASMSRLDFAKLALRETGQEIGRAHV